MDGQGEERHLCHLDLFLRHQRARPGQKCGVFDLKQTREINFGTKKSLFISKNAIAVAKKDNAKAQKFIRMTGKFWHAYYNQFLDFEQK